MAWSEASAIGSGIGTDPSVGGTSASAFRSPANGAGTLISSSVSGVAVERSHVSPSWSAVGKLPTRERVSSRSATTGAKGGSVVGAKLICPAFKMPWEGVPIEVGRVMRCATIGCGRLLAAGELIAPRPERRRAANV